MLVARAVAVHLREREEREPVVPEAAAGAAGSQERSVWDTMKRHEVQLLMKAGVAAQRISETTGVAKRSVWRIAKEADRDEPREDAATA